MVKKVILATLVLFALSNTFAYAFTTTLDLFGGFEYSVGGDVYFPDYFVPDIDTQTFGQNAVLQGLLNTNGPYYGAAAIDYRFAWNLPGWDDVYPWFLDIDVWASGTYDSNPFSVGYQEDHIYMGDFSLSGVVQDFTGSYYTKAQVINFIKGLPQHGFQPGLGGYYLDGNFHSGQLYLGLDTDLDDLFDYLGVNPIETASGEFGASLALTAGEPKVIPEPATLSLLGVSLLGLLGFRKRFAAEKTILEETKEF